MQQIVGQRVGDFFVKTVKQVPVDGYGTEGFATYVFNSKTKGVYGIELEIVALDVEEALENHRDLIQAIGRGIYRSPKLPEVVSNAN